MTEEPVTHYASKEDATKEATRRVAAGTRPEALAIVSTSFAGDSIRWFVRNMGVPADARSSQRPFVDVKRLNAEKREKFWITVAQAIAMACCGTFILFTLLATSCIPIWIVVPLCICIAAGAAKYLFWLLAPSDIFEPAAGFDCPNEKCHKYVAAYDPWICGHCDAVNMPIRNDAGAPESRLGNWLAQSCCKCSHQASSYLCHHCGEIIFFNAECVNHHPARAANKTYPEPKPLVIQEIQQVSTADDWKAQTESQIEMMIAEKLAFSAITQKVCGLRDAELKRIEDDQTVDLFTKNQLKEFEKQWANKKLQDLKTRVVRAR